MAAGSLGTGANLDETQVIRTEDLRAAAAPIWLDDDGPVATADGDGSPPDDQTMIQRIVAPPVREPAVSATVAPVRPAAPVARNRRSAKAPVDRRGLALVGVGAFATLVVLAGAGILSQLDLGASGGPGAPAGEPSFGFANEAQPSASPEPGSGKGHGSCKGKGHGSGDCD